MFSFSEKLMIVTVGEKKGEIEKSPIYDGYALKDVNSKFAEYFKGKFENSVCAQASERCETNLLLIGGSQANSITNHVLNSKKELKYYFRVDKFPQTTGPERDEIICRDDSSFVRRPEFKDGVLVKDQALITKCANNFKEGCAVIIVAGSHGAGTYGAMMALLDTPNLKFLYGNHEKYFQVLVSVEVLNTVPQGPILQRHTFAGISGN